MAEISYNSVFDAVTLALRKAFPTANIRGEAVKQGLNPGLLQMPARPSESPFSEPQSLPIRLLLT